MSFSVQSHDNLSLFISIFNHCLQAKKKIGVFPYHKQIIHYLSFLYKQGYILSYKICHYEKQKDQQQAYIFVWFKYYENIPVVRSLHLYSKPSKRYYMSYKKLKVYVQQYQHKKILVSTTMGLLYLNECYARQLGGILLFEIL